MGKEVVWGDEIDVVHMMVSGHLLHPLNDLVQVYRLAKSITGYLIVLAVGAPKRTSRKKDRSGPVGSSEGRLFTEMGPHVGNPQLGCLLAETSVTLARTA
jgi:hypothetical protein